MKKQWFTIEECIDAGYIEIKTKNLTVRVFKSEEVVLEDREKKDYEPVIVSYDRDMGGIFFLNPTVVSQLLSSKGDP